MSHLQKHKLSIVAPLNSLKPVVLLLAVTSNSVIPTRGQYFRGFDRLISEYKSVIMYQDNYVVNIDFYSQIVSLLNL